MKSRFSISCCCSGIPGGVTCGSCVVPPLLQCSWRYRSVSVADVAHCPPNAGSGVNTLVFPMNYMGGATGWISDWFKVSDHQYFCSNYQQASGLARIDPNYWVRVQMICSGTSYPVSYGSTITKDPTCLPNSIGLGACGDLGVAGKSTFGRIGVGLVLCDPFHAGGAVFQGTDTVEVDGKLFERMDITVP